jgi:cyclopropane fatty-acyl-phospholipid synthase-like methyltransferase
VGGYENIVDDTYFLSCILYVYMFSTPSLCLSQFNIEPGMVVADLGCGIGAYTIELAERVTSTGKVIAVDVQKDLIHTLEKTCK